MVGNLRGVKEGAERLVAAIEVDADRAVLDLAGEIDMATSGLLDGHLEDVVDRGAVHVVVDVEHVDFADSTFVTALLRARERVAPLGGSVRVVAPTAPVRRLLDITGVSTVPGIVVAAT